MALDRTFRIRDLPLPVRHRLKRMADSGRRSLSATILCILWEKVEELEKDQQNILNEPAGDYQVETDSCAVQIRCESELIERLRKLATADRRSINSLIVLILERSVQAR